MGEMDRDGDIPTLTGKLKVDWLDFPAGGILEQFITLKKAFFVVFIVKRPTGCLLLEKIDSMSHSWPKSGIAVTLQVEDLQARTFHMHRKFTRARHLWFSLRPDWNLIKAQMYTDWPGIYSYEEPYDRLFANPGRNDRINDTPALCGYYSWAYQEWQQQWWHMARFLGNEPCQVTMTLEAIQENYEGSLLKELQEVEERKGKRLVGK